jgi:hypothetical protein
LNNEGLVLTNQHVIDAMLVVPSHAQYVMLFPEPLQQDGQTTFGVVLRKLQAFNSISQFGFIVGERVGMNCYWYVDADGSYSWAGATDVPIPVTAKVKQQAAGRH